MTGSNAPSRRVRLDPEDRRDQILAAARRLFAERSFFEVSTTELAVAAGTTRTNLHYYFRTKRELYLEVVRDFGRLPPLPLGYRSRPTGEAELRRLLLRWLDVLAENPQTILTMVKAWAPGVDPEVAAVFRLGALAWQERLLAVLELPDNPRSRAALRSFQSMAGAALEEWLGKQQLTRDDVHELLTSTLLSWVPALSERQTTRHC